METAFNMKQPEDFKSDSKELTGLGVAVITRGWVSMKWMMHMNRVQGTYPVGMFWKYLVVEGRGWAEARIEAVHKAKAMNFEWLLFIDDDVFIPDDAVNRLLSSGKKVISGVYWTKTDPARPVIFKRMGDGPYDNFPIDEVVEVSGSGLGCCLIHMSVFDEFDKSNTLYFQENWIYTDPKGMRMKCPVGEDHYFFTKAKELGFKVWADTGCLCDHYDYKTKRFFPGEKTVRELAEQKLRQVGRVDLIETHKKQLGVDSNKQTICFFNATANPFAGNELEKRGIGGSEGDVIHLSRIFANRWGFNVHVFCNCTEPGIYDNVVYHDIKSATSEDIAEINADLFILSRNVDVIQRTDFKTLNAKKVCLWAHDLATDPIWKGVANALPNIDKIFALTEWHRRNIILEHKIPMEKFFIARNGIDMNRFKDRDNVPVTSGKCIYSSTPFRGLDVLLEVWPQIRARVSHATLHVFSSMKVYGSSYDDSKFEHLYAQARSMKDLGVHYYGTVTQSELAKQFLTSELLTYPNTYDETCLPEGTLISSENGVIPVEEVGEGDMVLTHKGRHCKVIGTNSRKTDCLVNLNMQYGYSLSLTPNHPVYVVPKEKVRKHRLALCEGAGYSKTHLVNSGEWVEAGNLCPGDFVKLQSDQTCNSKSEDCVKSVIGRTDFSTLPRTIQFDSDFMRFCGLYVAEGYYNDSGSCVTISFNSNEEDYINYVRDFVKDRFGIKTNIQVQGNGTSVKIYSRPLGRLMKILFGNKERLKKLPREFMTLESSLQDAFLKGLFDGDGCVDSKDFSHLDSASEQLIDQVRLILLRKGIVCSKRMREINGRKYYKISYSNAKVCVHYLTLSDGVYIRIADTSKCECDVRVYNFEVEEDNSYVAQNIAVHNCCITVFEAQASGTPIVTSAKAALNETVPDNVGVKIEGNPYSEEYKNQFVDACVELLTDKQMWATKHKACLTYDYSWDKISEEWIKEFFPAKLSKPDSPEVPNSPNSPNPSKVKEVEERKKSIKDELGFEVNSPEYWDEVYKKDLVRLNRGEMVRDDPERYELMIKEVYDGDKVLDIGCGLGHWTRYVRERRSKCEIWGSDISHEALDYCREMNRTIFYANHPVDNDEFESNYFDVVTAEHIIEHFENPKKIILKMRRIVKSDGKIILVIPVNDEPWHEHPRIWQIPDIYQFVAEYFPRDKVNIQHRYDHRRHYSDGRPFEEAIIVIKLTGGNQDGS